MDDETANVTFREQFRRTLSKPNSHHPGNGPNSHRPGPDEDTPLLDEARNGRSRPPGDGHSDGDSPAWRQFLLNRRNTPGRGSDNPIVRYSSSVWHITKVTLLSNYVNFLLFVVPVGIVAGHRGASPELVFTLNFFAIIPLAAVLSFATEEISMKLGETMGGLLNATFGNAVELIVSIVALRDGQIEVVQASMLGSILSNLLLVMGMCFLFGGIWNWRNGDGEGVEQNFASGTAQTTCSLMALSSASLVIPAALYSVLDHNADDVAKERTILIVSRGTAIILLILYVLYLWFQLKTHKNLFDSEAQGSGQHHEPEEPIMGPIAATMVLVVTTVIVAVCAEYLVGSIDAIVESAHISKTFIGLILIPIVGNAAEHVTAVVVAIRNKMDLAMGVAIGSSIQIAILVTPFLVIVGWIIHQPMTLHFETFATVAFAFSVLVVTYTVQDGKSNYLEGAMLLGLYFIIALAFYASPSDAIDKVYKAVTSG